jgi:flagellar protein FliO/FliZ
VSNFSIPILFWQNTQPVPTVGWLDIVWLLVQTAIALGIVCGLAILIFRYILPRLNVVSLNKSIVNVVDGTSLDARKRLIIVEVAGKYMLLALSESGVQLVSELDGAAVEKAVAEMAKPPVDAKKGLFTQTIDKVWQKRK